MTVICLQYFRITDPTAFKEHFKFWLLLICRVSHGQKRWIVLNITSVTISLFYSHQNFFFLFEKKKLELGERGKRSNGGYYSRKKVHFKGLASLYLKLSVAFPDGGGDLEAAAAALFYGLRHASVVRQMLSCCLLQDKGILWKKAYLEEAPLQDHIISSGNQTFETWLKRYVPKKYLPIS